MRQVRFDLDTQSIEQGSGPTRLQAQPGGLATDGEDGQRDENPGNYQQDQSKDAEGAEEKMGFVQAGVVLHAMHW